MDKKQDIISYNEFAIDIINERPEGMSYEDYKIELRFQKAWLKEHKKGRFYYIANDVVYPFEGVMAKFGVNKTYPPFKGKTKDLINPI